MSMSEAVSKSEQIVAGASGDRAKTVAFWTGDQTPPRAETLFLAGHRTHLKYNFDAFENAFLGWVNLRVLRVQDEWCLLGRNWNAHDFLNNEMLTKAFAKRFCIYLQN